MGKRNPKVSEISIIITKKGMWVRMERKFCHRHGILEDRKFIFSEDLDKQNLPRELFLNCGCRISLKKSK